jgi:prepilin-type N-terminal cleavage/methylation domain-containing protein
VKIYRSKLLKGRKGGFALVELLVGSAVFLILAVGVYGAFTTTLKLISASRAKVVAMDLANEQFEIVRNLPYANVGIVSGIPVGSLAHVQTLSRSGFTFIATTTVRNIDDPFDGTIGGNPNDLSPADNKLVEIEIGCAACKNFVPVFVNTRVAPKNLETASTNGALFINVLDASGQPVPDAAVHVVNTIASPSITIDDSTNASGVLQIVDAPPGVNAYQITITKPGYTSDKTYLPGAAGNPNPLKPHATVAVQQVTQISFIIDKVSTMNVSSITQSCTPVPSVDFSLKGTRLIGTGPDVLKYDQNHTTNSSGQKEISSLEWDAYSLSVSNATYDLIGTNPIFPLNLVPDSVQNTQLILAPKNPKSLLVIVKDSATQLPLSNSTVTLENGPYNESLVTGLGFITQTDWSHGGGQGTSTDVAKYFSSSNIDSGSPVGEIKLTGSFGVYDTSGYLTSSTYDTGSASNFQQLLWQPLSQPPSAGSQSVKFQIATNNDTTTWNFLGPNGTASDYYTTANTNINAVHSGDRFLRYKIYLSTDDTAFTPNISDVSFTFTSSCIPPGQVLFSGLSSGTYDVTVSHAGYSDYSGQVTISPSWQQAEVSLSPL